MITNILRKIFGTKDEREVKRIFKYVEKINSLEENFIKLSDEELKSKTKEFKDRLTNGETLDDILVEAFATVREASKRTLGMRHFDVQLIGGMVLHEGKIAEMKTGEGKTLVATCPVYLNALMGKVHVVTVNDYLAKRDKEWMSKIYTFLGLSVNVILGGMSSEQRKDAYNSDIVYGTNNEFGFDYLRDNMVSRIEDRVQKSLDYAIVDEVDSILVDEARTPLIISGAASESLKYYKQFSEVAKLLIKDKDYEVDLKAHAVIMNEDGIKRVESLLSIDNLYSPENVDLTHYLNQSLKAKELFKKDKDYIVKNGEVIIVDEFTGRLMDGRRYSEGLHQAIEAKEGVRVASENQTLATITLQNYFRMYKKLSGMTGTAKTEENEFVHIYKLPVVTIPTNKTLRRKDHGDMIYKTVEEKFEAVIDKIIEINEKGQPILVGTTSIANSEVLSKMLNKKGIKHNVLNAKFHEKEAEIVAQAGRYKAVTIATNMAGRGTDILLGGNPEFMAKNELDEENPKYQEVLARYRNKCDEEKQQVLNLGGLYILGTERHESRRIDNQLRGRSGRQGDPGESSFFISLEDDLMKLFGSDRVAKVMDRLGYKYKEPIHHPLITRSIENAQKRVESKNFSVRKQLLEYDDVMNRQREIIYSQRNTIMSKNDLSEEIKKIMIEALNTRFDLTLGYEENKEEQISNLLSLLENRFDYKINKEEINLENLSALKEKMIKDLWENYDQKMSKLSPEGRNATERGMMLEVIDARWKENLKTLDSVRDSIHLQSYGQKDPIVEYKLVSYKIYDGMIKVIKEEIASYLIKMEV